jgi:hypothetical protein
MAASGRAGPFAAWLVGMAVIHLLLQVSVLWRMYRIQSPSVASAAWWYPLAGFVSDWILLRAIVMCFTGRVTWRGTAYGEGVFRRGAETRQEEREIQVG